MYKSGAIAHNTEIKIKGYDNTTVKVLSVNTMRYDGKKRTRNGGGGAIVGYTPKWKKAVVRIDTDPKTVEYTVNGQKKTKKYKSVIEDYGFTQ